MDKEYMTWLASLKVGDRVAVKKSGNIVFSKISNITNGGIKVEYDENLLFKDGSDGDYQILKIKDDYTLLGKDCMLIILMCNDTDGVVGLETKI